MNHKPGDKITYDGKEVELVQLRYTEEKGESWIVQYLQDGEYYIIYLEHEGKKENENVNKRRNR